MAAPENRKPRVNYFLSYSQEIFRFHFNQAPSYHTSEVPVSEHEREDGTTVGAHTRSVKTIVKSGKKDSNHTIKKKSPIKTKKKKDDIAELVAKDPLYMKSLKLAAKMHCEDRIAYHERVKRTNKKEEDITEAVDKDPLYMESLKLAAKLHCEDRIAYHERVKQMKNDSKK